MIYVYSELQSGISVVKESIAVLILVLPAYWVLLLQGLIPGISAAGATPKDREYTAIADAEFLAKGVQSDYHHPLPILTAGISPTFISRAVVVEALDLPTYIFNAGLPHPPTVDTIDLAGIPAKCLSSGRRCRLKRCRHLFERGLEWGEKLAETTDYLIIGECVVGGTTTALALLDGFGYGSKRNGQ